VIKKKLFKKAARNIANRPKKYDNLDCFSCNVLRSLNANYETIKFYEDLFKTSNNNSWLLWQLVGKGDTFLPEFKHAKTRNELRQLMLLLAAEIVK